ncbi:molybdenum ABC transporter ATP-binding protein [Alcanivorax sp. 1008]|uniref:molybdenum ABC transporter ATP-binding protein n=1 Tax=Alcanivorax sp. 1008 TaxID=2816853 RepID=UPI001DA448A7|nr:molybdenum ABC transporter ATP-binding protein [Alcanivorax sp. 1008]MCC1495347.1 molybdenum ABC transporter ATP-binding protein [Alcanivorax sp. 1008]
MKTDAGHVTAALSRPDFTLDVDIKVPSHGVTGIFGASGCGKTTLLRCIAGLERDARGSVGFNGQLWQDSENFVPPWQRPVGFVFQDARLFPHMTVARNLNYGRRRSAPSPELSSPEQIIDMLGIGHLLDRKPAQLSGGEQQRASIARALLRYPALVLMDEPLANLDAGRKQEIMPFLDRLHANLQVPMLYVSHSLDEMTRLCDHLVVMQSGRVLGQGRLHDMLMRTDLPTLGGGEASTVLDVRVLDYDPHYQLSRLQFAGGEVVVPGRHGDHCCPLRLRIMASDVSLCRERPQSSSILNILPAVVESRRAESGGHVLVQLRVGEAKLMARVTLKSAEALNLTQGQSLFAQIKGVAVKNSAEQVAIDNANAEA